MFFNATDDELMMQVAQGNPNAFRTLFDRHGSRVLGYCSRYMGTRNLNRAEDTAQEVWMKLVRAAADYRREGKFTSWLLTIARTTCLDALRGKENWAEIQVESESDLPVADLDDAPASAEELLSKHESLRELKRQIDALPDGQRTVLLMWIQNDASYEEIACELGLSLSSVKSLLFRAKQSLEKQMRGAS